MDHPIEEKCSPSFRLYAFFMLQVMQWQERDTGATMSIHMLLIPIVAVGVPFFVICILGFVRDLRRPKQKQPIKSKHNRTGLTDKDKSQGSERRKVCQKERRKLDYDGVISCYSLVTDGPFTQMEAKLYLTAQ